jgi:hypothetical protein
MITDYNLVVETVRERIPDATRNPNGYVFQRLGLKSKSQWSDIKNGRKPLPEKYHGPMELLQQELGLVNGTEHHVEALAPEPEPAAAVEVLVVEPAAMPEPEPERATTSEPVTALEPEPAAAVEALAVEPAAAPEPGHDDMEEGTVDVEDVDLDALVEEGEAWVAAAIEESPALSLNGVAGLFEHLIQQGADDAVRGRVIRAIKEHWPGEDANALKAMWRDAENALASTDDLEETDSEAALLEKLNIPVVEPWAEPVDGLALAAELEATVRTYITASEGDYTIVPLWVFHSYAIPEGLFRVTPRLAITSPQKGCGKTTLLDIVMEVSYRGITTSDVSNAVFFRVTEKLKASVGIDERDRGSRKELDTLINDGWSARRRGGVMRMDKGSDDTLSVSVYRVFVPVALAGIGGVGSDTLRDRCVEVRLHRQTEEEAKPKLTDAALEAMLPLASRLLRWISDHRDALLTAPRMADIPGMTNRALDNWSVLFAIAYTLGGEWPGRVIRAASALVDQQVTSVPDTNGIELVTDIIRIAEDHARRRQVEGGWSALSFPSDDLVKRLHALDDGKWKEMGDSGRQVLTANKMARLLHPFGIRPDRLERAVRGRRVSGGPRGQARGYRMSDFREVRVRYIRDQDVGEL